MQVRKTIAAALEVVGTTLASAALFGTPLNASALASALLVAGGVVLYSRPYASPERSASTSYELLPRSPAAAMPMATLADVDDEDEEAQRPLAPKAVAGAGDGAAAGRSKRGD